MKRTWSERDEYGQLGIIESVSLRNFMCHDNLSFDFDPHMNFIVGRNGSGKSAVLTAVILALGGKSGSTGRYSNIKGFIKTGKSSATVSVTLKNCGVNAYRQKEFGEKIIVERHFTSEGISSYKLKSQAGRIISTSKEELINILTVMDIQIENPITVLTQEISKNFLLSKKPDKLFQLFFKGTGLAKVQDDYIRCRQQDEEMREELEKKKSILPDMDEDIKKLKSLLDKSTKVTELKKELLWALVIELEKRRDETKAALEKVGKDYSDVTKKLKDHETQLGNIQQEINATKSDKKDSTEKRSSIAKDLDEMNQKRISLSKEIRQIQGNISSHERQLKKFTDDIKSLENIINEIKMKNQNDVQEDKLRHETILKTLRTDINGVKSQVEMLEMKKNTVRETEANLQKQIDTCHAEIQDMEYSANNIRRERQQLMDGKINRINVFGQEMVNVLQDIKRAVRSRAFKVEPKGPIGLYINVKQPEWNFAVQECLKSNFLKTFVCDNHADAECLTKIFNKHYQRNRPSIITTKFVNEVYDVSSHKTVCDHPTLLDKLDISDPVVTNCLIDQRQIENILLIEDEREARTLMLHSPPHKCSYAYTPNGDQYCHSPYRNYSCRNRNQICMLKTVNEEDIRRKNEELSMLDLSLSAKHQEKEYLVQQLNQNEREITRIDHEITNFKIQLQALNVRLNNEENSHEEPKDVNCLQIDLEQLEKDKNHQEEQYISCKTVIHEKNNELEYLDKRISDSKRCLQVESWNLTTSIEKLNEFEIKKEKCESVIKKSKDQLRQIEPVLEDRKIEVANVEATVMVATKNAEDTTEGTRIETRKSPDTIRQILEETKKFIQQQRNCDQQAILKEYEEKIQNFKKKKVELERLERINAKLNDMLRRRFDAFRKTCNNTSLCLTCCFTVMLRENSFTGTTKVNFEEQLLQIVAKPNKTNSKKNESTHLSQLSGGERSYVTIAFLLSLWDRINMPFRILDEFDVFMDSNNRHLSINLLVNTAKTNKKIQYIFLSPLELPDIEDSDHVKVHKMPPPRK